MNVSANAGVSANASANAPKNAVSGGKSRRVGKKGSKGGKGKKGKTMKKRSNPYMDFVKKHRAAVVKSMPKASITDIGRELGKRYRAQKK
jgi:hypothetical protein